MLKYNHNLKPLARSLRSNMTDAENSLWFRLRRKQVLDTQFYRQKPIGNYIVDFYAPRAKLVIEVDGSQHLNAEHLQRDEERDDYLARQGLLVVRFNNLQVLKELDGVMESIFQAMLERLD